MRTTLDIDQDILLAAKELAGRSGKTAGQVISELARRGLHAPAAVERGAQVKNGFEILPAAGRVVTPELVERLLDDTEDS
jgi:hypothetical protein